MGYKNHINIYFFFPRCELCYTSWRSFERLTDYNWSDLPNLGDFQWRVNFDTLRFYLYLYVIQHNKSRSVDQSYCCWGPYICTACGSGALLWTKFSLDRISSLHIWSEAVQRPSYYFGPVWSTGIGAWCIPAAELLVQFPPKGILPTCFGNRTSIYYTGWPGFSLQNLTVPNQLVTRVAASHLNMEFGIFYFYVFNNLEKRNINS